LGGEDFVEVLRPDDGGRDPRNTFAVDAAIEDAGKFYPLGRVFTQDAGYGIAYGTKT
jgi:hypothetical protein